ncbi:fibronectin type III domain-containing protein [Streptomyces sp. NPDC005408]|uniref:fibronectin type III domain-containing protein n=1 Tax=Streptomyces sp. NPDC005408 TaxID=3155341 RepID=UPI0033B8DB6B
MRLRTSTTKTAAAACATACLTAAAFVAAPGSAAAEGTTTLTADPLATWQTNGIVWSLAYARGVVYAGGSFTSVRPPGAAPGEKEKTRTNFAAFDAVTGKLLPCAPAFSGGANTVRAMKPSRDGSVLYVGGSFGKVGSTGVASAVALNTADCSLRKDFRPAVSATVRAIDVTDKAVYLGGDFTTVSGQARSRIAALSPSGKLLPFNAEIDGPVRAITAAEKHGKVFVGGDFDWVQGNWAHALVALDPSTGSTVQTYENWIPARSVVKALAHDGTNFYLGAEGTGTWMFDGRIAGDLATGELRWKDNCLGATQAVVPYKGILYSGSHAHDCSDTPGGFPEHKKRHHFVANSIANKTIQYWFPDTNDGLGEQLGPRAMVMANGILWTGGEFTTVNDKPQQGLTRFGDGPDIGAPDVPKLAVSSTSATVNELSWQASWDRDDAVLTYKIYRDGALLKSLAQRSAYWDRPQMHFTDTVTANTRHRYSITVTDGDNTSPHSGRVTVSAALAQTGTADKP